jgi:DNA excision repair protein ERCC-2
MDNPPELSVAVRALCEFAAREGDLDLRFTPAPTSLEGIAGHALVASRRGAGWQAEFALHGRWTDEAGRATLAVRGRADGWDARRGRLEEVKTHKGSLDRQAANQRALHWAQLKVYGALLCEQEGLDRVELALVYVDVQTQQETVFAEVHERAGLLAFFSTLCQRQHAWAEQEALHRQARDAALRELRFPLPTFRAGQRELAEAVYRAMASGRCLLAEAPTGIGKTLGTVFPTLKAMPGRSIDKVFFLTAKTSGRALALDAAERLHGGATEGQPLPLRTLELVARDKACEHPDKACHGESCPLAQGFYDRLPVARAALVGQPCWDQATVREQARAHQVCPYYLTQEMARWADLIVGDHNHFFDTHAMLHALTRLEGWRVAVLVDEAHNLVDRARAMHSAEMSQDRLLAARALAPAAVRRALDRLHRSWLALNRRHGLPYQVLDDVPEAWTPSLQKAVQALGEHLEAHPADAEPALQAFHLDALAFLRLADVFAPHSLVDLSMQRSRLRPLLRSTLTLRNVWPAPFLAPRFESAHSVVLFSATLQPFDHFQRLLGLPDDTARVSVASPFGPGQLPVRVARHISTRWRDRQASVDPMVELMAETFAAHPGNHLAFFSSHDYLQQVAERFQALHPDVPVWLQARGMSEADQRAFLQRFEPEGRGIGFAVLGGSFGEGVDLPGSRLVGAFIATLGLPQVNEVNEHMRERLDELIGAGHDAIYLVPGLHKVAQAAGRVIRTPHDRGTLVLMDDRYQRPDVRRLLPDWWGWPGAEPKPTRTRNT